MAGAVDAWLHHLECDGYSILQRGFFFLQQDLSLFDACDLPPAGSLDLM